MRRRRDSFCSQVWNGPYGVIEIKRNNLEINNVRKNLLNVYNSV
jgi:hypothetical protein